MEGWRVEGWFEFEIKKYEKKCIFTFYKNALFKREYSLEVKPPLHPPPLHSVDLKKSLKIGCLII